MVIFLMFTKDGEINKITLSHLYSRGGEMPQVSEEYFEDKRLSIFGKGIYYGQGTTK